MGGTGENNGIRGSLNFKYLLLKNLSGVDSDEKKLRHRKSKRFYFN